MTTPPMFSGFDGLMSLSRREGVDIRPTLLRVLTDLYVQAPSHTTDEEQQFVELTSRLIDQVDDATRAAVRGRLAIYPNTPAAIAEKLGLTEPKRPLPLARSIDPDVALPRAAAESFAVATSASTLPNDAAQISDMFFAADTRERTAIIDTLATSQIKPSAPLPAARVARAIHILEMAAFAVDVENFTLELGDALILPPHIAAQIVNDAGGEPLACALKALGMKSDTFQRVLLFLNPDIGASVNTVYRLSRLYDRLSQRSALVMLAAWRGASAPAQRARYRPMLHDDERHRARNTVAQPRTETPRPGIDINTARNKAGD
ncbi:MAG: DUF2336 domain-containing protein [Rhizobiales bacterium 62-47]|nr:DUF2336 domain-containing protein [Hyphomicrobiales bacterium]OJY08460.1 MAG: DUF2336 domain-containing protein [Rhizobiales bacterium 62-47]